MADYTRGLAHVFLKDVGYAVSTHWPASGVSEDRFIVGIGVADFTQCRGRFWPERTEALFLAFTEETHLPRGIEAELSHANAQGFANSRAGIVEEQKKRSIP
jgi:hypothetical protein